MPSTPSLPSIWSAPLVPIALAATTGIVADRYLQIPLAVSFALTLAGILLWLIFTNTSKRTLALVYLWASFIGLGAAWHHWHRYHVDPGDLSHSLGDEPQPVRLRGELTTAPIYQSGKADSLRSFATGSSTRFVLRARQRQDLATRTWSDVTGLVQVTVAGDKRDVTVGDSVELLGRLALPGHPMNPGEFDYGAFLRDQGITTTLIVYAPADVTLIQRGWATSIHGVLAVIRGWGQDTLARDLGNQHEVAAALLLGEGSGMSGEAWEQYMRTGVIHVLAISGQHLVVLAGFFWFLARVIGVRRRHAALVIALVLISYALLTGGRPPVMRAAWVVAAYCGGILLKRPVLHANTFALAWLGVLVFNPADIFSAGCQLSFLAVAVLVWGIAPWARAEADPLQRVIHEKTPWYGLATLWFWRGLLAGYAINAIVSLAVTPLVASQYHVVSPAALFIGPPMVLLSSIALVTGFLFLVFSWMPLIALPFAWITKFILFLAESLVSFSSGMPGACFYVSDIPAWWLWVFYLGLLIALTVPIVHRYAWHLVALGIAWLGLAVALQLWPHRPGELRVTVVAVGHGGCTVIETPNGRVLMYDAGATTGPSVTRRHIAPFLWSRGIRHIDELILSHGDLDHFNGIPQLADRFSIGRVRSTPTFAERESSGMKQALAALDKRGLTIDVVKRGDVWEIDGVSLEVLHPPAIGPTKNENARSLVLLVKHKDWSMLLTGDLEDEGLSQVLAMPPMAVEVLMAPHHGSDRSNIEALGRWARPALVVSSQAEPISPRVSVPMYEKMGARFLGTWPNGAITIRPDSTDEYVTTFRPRSDMPARR